MEIAITTLESTSGIRVEHRSTCILSGDGEKLLYEALAAIRIRSANRVPFANVTINTTPLAKSAAVIR